MGGTWRGRCHREEGGPATKSKASSSLGHLFIDSMAGIVSKQIMTVIPWHLLGGYNQTLGDFHMSSSQSQLVACELKPGKVADRARSGDM